jgi:hypothetical protein
MSGSSGVFPTLSWTSFKVSGLILRSLNPLWVDTSIGWETWIYFQFFAGKCPVFPATFVEETVFSPFYVLGAFVKNQVDIVVWIFIWVFCCTGLHVCFCASTMLFLLLWLCSIFWSQELWYLQCCSFCLVLPYLFEVFCASIWTLGLIFFSLCDECHWNFDGNWIEM